MARDLVRRGQSSTQRWLRCLAAVLLVASGVVHLQQYFGVHYRVVPVIGPLFVADFVLAVLLGVLLVTPVDRITAWMPKLVALGGVAFALGSIVGLEISERAALFGFHEHGYRLAIVLSLIFEAAAALALLAYLAVRPPRRRRVHEPQMAESPAS